MKQKTHFVFTVSFLILSHLTFIFGTRGEKRRIMVVYETTKRSKTDIFNLLQATQNSFELRQKQYFHFYSLFIEVYRLLSTLHKQYDSIKNF